MLKTAAIKAFLSNQPYELGKLYTSEMEVQVNVARDNGEPITDIYEGVRWQGFTDGVQTWKHFRIPWNAKKDPKYIDKDINFDISEHAEAIGMTGWNWYRKESRWVGFDIDAINHKKGLTNDEIEELKEIFRKLRWASLYTSTSGLGLHLYIFTVPTHTGTHTEHAAVARAILNKLSISTGLQLDAKIDCMGGNMWVWHRKAIPSKSYQPIFKHSELLEVPKNWQDYLPRVSKKVYLQKKQDDISILVNSLSKQKLDEDHLKVLNWFEASNSQWWWDDQRQMLICHTFDLKRCHNELKLRGVFETTSTGKDATTGGGDHNCFAIPLDNGGWCIRRYSKGTPEHPYWCTDHQGWTKCWYNATPSIAIAFAVAGGVFRQKDYYFKSLTTAAKALEVLGITLDIPINCEGRPGYIKRFQEYRISVSFPVLPHDPEFVDWIKEKNSWVKFFNLPHVAEDVDLPDEQIRHIINDDETSSSDLGWCVRIDDDCWVEEPRSNVISALQRTFNPKQIPSILGQCVLHPWKVVNIPFQPEYPGKREWNRNAAQFRFNPERGKFPSWMTILNHIGKNLNEALSTNNWAKDNAIMTGADYLVSWCAWLFQKPEMPLPYLFLFGPQNCGKSIFHEALSLLVTKGVCRADVAITNPSGFNAELINAIICVIEETNLSKKGYALERIKDWVTSRVISIHKKGMTPYSIENMTHWIQCANDSDWCPILPGDTRITAIRVSDLENEIPKSKLEAMLQDEAPAFLNHVLNFELPTPINRLGIPVIESDEKSSAMEYNKSALQTFVEERTYCIQGSLILFSEFYNTFVSQLSPNDRGDFTNRRVAKELRNLYPEKFPLAKYGGEGQLYIGNMSFTKDKRPELKLVKRGDRLCPT